MTDLEEDQIKLLPIICESYPWMGAKGIKTEAYDRHLALFIKNIKMDFSTQRNPEGLKIFMYLAVEFTERNAEHGFNIINNLINDHDDNNLEVLSKRIQRKASETYHSITENLVDVHGLHVAGTCSPYAML